MSGRGNRSNQAQLKPELLSPAGNWECARAAIANGADAIYFGLDRFNARLRADNFKVEDLPSLMNYLHRHNARGFVTMNTLIFTDEMQNALDYVAELNAAGVDGVIVQDIGFAHLLTEWKREDPSIKLELHASTQMTLSSSEGLAFVGRFLNLQRAVMARELSIDGIEECAQGSDVPLEVFVHGALCVAYSGQCLTSESLGQRSANRGECAQACRMPYTLVKDGSQIPLGEKRYLLSPQDLCSVDLIDRLVELGVKSYKIEGRLKSPEYVAAVTRAYRKALDAAIAKSPVNQYIGEKDRYAMQMVFSRGFSSGWLEGTDHPRLTHGRHGKKRGAYVGTIKSTGRGWVDIGRDSRIPLSPGDGFVFDEGSDRNEEQGGRIWKVEKNRLFFHGKGGHIDWSKVHPGQKVWKTDDPALNGELRKTWQGAPLEDGIPIDIHCSGSLGQPLVLECRSASIKVESDAVLESAINRPLTADIVKTQLERLGGTGFRLGRCIVDLPDGLIMPLSAINATRRTLVDLLKHAAIVPHARTGKIVFPPSSGKADREKPSPVLSVLCRSVGQIAPVLRQGVSQIYLDFEDLRTYRQGLEQVKNLAPDAEVFLATPRIHKPGETGYFKLIENYKPDGVLIRNLGAAEYFRNSSLKKTGDFSLNVVNPHTASILLKEGGFDRVTISYDLNGHQVADLLEHAPPKWFELTLHQHMPMFHMEHCVFCTFLSKGHNYRDCGRPCEKHRVELKDRVGQMHPLIADVGCRNTLFNGRAQTGAAFFDTFSSLGLSHYRVELLNEPPVAAGRIAASYRELLKGNLGAAALVRNLGAWNQLGVTTLPE